jgi:predicted O-methyltransferase YrrM
MNHYSLAKNAKNIIEIGFNAGHSCLLYLLANNESHITVFDICEHKYTIPCFEYLQSLFPNRLTLYSGDSVETVPLFYKNNIDVKLDLIHIDGDRYNNIPKIDFDNVFKLASNIIILDSKKKINDVFNEYVNNKKIYEIFLYETFMYQHRICKVFNL